MPTIMTHAIVPLAAGLALGRARIPGAVLLAGMALAVLPDADVIGFKFGVPYADPFGHRGASHALFTAAVVAGLAIAALRPARAVLAYAFLFASMASHGLFDSLTSGGLGPALLWPFSDSRYFAPVTPIHVSPIGAGFFSARGVTVMLSELLWVWLPVSMAALIVRFVLLRKPERGAA